VVQLDVLLVLGRVAVDADDHPLALFDLLLPAERRLFDLCLDEALLDSRDRTAELVDLPDQLDGALLELVGQCLQVERAAERIGRRGRAGLGLKDLLRTQRDRRRVLGR
jgi:hypothetical protein